MIGKQVGETVLAQPFPHEPLQDVHVGIPVALDDHRPVGSRGDIPADHHPVGEMPVRRQGKALGIFPKRQRSSLDWSRCIGMQGEPAEPRIGAEVGCPRQTSAAQVDRSGNPAGVKIVDRPVVADGHAEHCTDQLGLAALIQAGDQPHGRQRSRGEVKQLRMGLHPRLNDQALPPGTINEPRQQGFSRKPLAAGFREHTWSNQVPPLRAAAPAVIVRFHEKIALGECVVRHVASNAGQRFDAAKPPFAAIFGEPGLVGQRRTPSAFQERKNAGLGLEPLDVAARAFVSALLVKREDIIPGREHAGGKVEPELITELRRDPLARSRTDNSSVAEREPKGRENDNQRGHNDAADQFQPFCRTLRVPVAARERRPQRIRSSSLR